MINDSRPQNHTFMCLKWNDRYLVMDSYIGQKKFEIRSFDVEQFASFMKMVINEIMTPINWRYFI